MWEGNKVRLRKIEKNDIKFTQKWYNDPEIVKFTGNLFPVSTFEEEKWFEKVILDDRRKVFIIEKLNDGQPIGDFYIDVDWRHRHAELSITIGETNIHNKGYATDAIHTAIRYIFNRLGLNRVYSRVFNFNKASLKAFEKCGLKKEGILRQEFYWNGAYQDRVVMSLLKDDFINHK